MTLSERKIALMYDEVACGNADALKFIFHWNLYCHGIDDIVDGSLAMRDPEQVVGLFAEANLLYTLPFYRANWERLQSVVMLITNAYADSVMWEDSYDKGQRTMADVLRFAGNEMLFAVALICGGYQHMRRVSAKLRNQSWQDHHDQHGEKI
jgi:hypothetical protein